MKLKFRANKVQKKRREKKEKTIRLIRSNAVPYSHSTCSFTFTRNKNPSPLHDFKISSAKLLVTLLHHHAKNNDLFFTNVSRKSRHNLETAAKFHGQFNRAAPQNRGERV